MPAPRMVSMPAPHENSTPTQRAYERRHSALAKLPRDRQKNERCIPQVTHRGSRCRVDATLRPFGSRRESCYDV